MPAAAVPSSLGGPRHRLRLSYSAAAWRAVASELDATMPVDWLFHARGVQGRSRKLDGVQMDLRGELVSIARWTRRDTR